MTEGSLATKKKNVSIQMVNGRDVFVSEFRECFCDSPVEGHS
jgi:hypothetical protein